MRYRYFNPFEQEFVEGEVASGADAAALVGQVATLRADCSPAVEFQTDDGASMVIGVDHDRAVVLWTSVDGLTRHTLGRPGGRAMFDFFGACTQMPGHYAVPLTTALTATGAFVDAYPLGAAGPALPLVID